MTDAAVDHAWGRRLSWAGACGLVCVGGVRALLGVEPLPGWDTDPTVIASNVTGLSAGGLLTLDALALALTAVVLLGERLRGRGPIWWMLGLWVMGTVGVVINALARWGLSLDDARIGFGWASAVGTGVALAHAGRDEALRRVTLATVLALAMLLAARGATQVTVEHDLTIEAYQRNKEAFLTARGWREGSVAALEYERRLANPEATGWFGLANVVASFGAGAAVWMAGVVALAIRHQRQGHLPSGHTGLVVLGAAASLGLLYLSGAKGGYAACAGGLALLALAAIVQRRSLKPPPVGLGVALAAAAIVGPLAVLAVRGLMGEGAPELSLLFRWFYVSTAARVGLEHWTLGVGPAGFQAAYAIAKPPLSPEDVQSPHSVLLDYWATLGALGLGWCVLVVGWALRAGTGLMFRSSSSPSTRPHHTPARGEVWFILASVGFPVAVSAAIELPALSAYEAILGAITRGVGALAWAAVAGATVSTLRLGSGDRWAAGAAALAVVAHSQIEMTPIWSGSAWWVMAVLGASSAAPPSLRRCSSVMSWAPVGMVAALAGAVAVFGAAPAVVWSLRLQHAAALVAPIPELTDRVRALQMGQASPAHPGDTPRAVAGDVAALLGRPPAGDFDELVEQLGALRLMLLAEAHTQLGSAIDVVPGHKGTLQAQSSLAVQLAILSDGAGDQGAALAWFSMATEAATLGARSRGGTSVSGWSWLASVWSARYASSRSATGGDITALDQALLAWEEADRRDPYGLGVAVRLMELHALAGRHEQARAWARTALDREKLKRLDPIKALTDSERAQAEALAGTP